MNTSGNPQKISVSHQMIDWFYIPLQFMMSVHVPFSKLRPEKVLQTKGHKQDQFSILENI